MLREPIGVLLMAYGSPTSLDDLEAYYTDIRRGRPPTSELLLELKERYRQIGGFSPLNHVTAMQAAGLQRQLHGRSRHVRVYVGMKHWRPRIASAVAAMAEDGVRRAVGLVLAPHYSRLSVGDYHARALEANAALDDPLDLTLVDCWHLEPRYVRAVASRVVEGLARFPPQQRPEVAVVFTAHSLPARIQEWDDPYPGQIGETAAAVARQARLGRWSAAWQSAGRTPEPWLGPDVKQVLAEQAAAGATGFLVCPVGFVADHMETLWDLDIDCRAHAQRLGVRLERTHSLNAAPDFLAALAGIVRARLLQPVAA